MNEELIKSLFENLPEQFTPYSYQEGNALTVYFKDERDYADQLDQRITLYRSVDTNEIVGIRIDGMPAIELMS